MNGPIIRLIGNVTRKPELRHSQNDGTPFITIPVATNRRRNNQETDTTYFAVTLWRHDAEYAANNVDKGTGIYAEGHFSLSKYTRKDGTQATRCEVAATDFEIVTRGAPAASLWAQHRPQGAATPDQPQPADTMPQDQPPAELDEDYAGLFDDGT